MDIHWDHPRAFLALWLLLPVAVLLWWCARQRTRQSRLLLSRMRQRLVPERTRAREWVRGALLLGALASLTLAATRPRQGLEFEEVVERSADVMVLLDVSRSMLSQDLVPSRLERARSDVRDLLQHLVGDRVGLVAFAGKAVVLCPLTTDQAFLLEVLDDAGPDDAPRGGTAIGDAIRTALDSLRDGRDRDRALLLITDGEDHDSFPREAAAEAAAEGVRLFTVGLGDPEEGARVPVGQDSGEPGWLKHEGAEVWSRMDENLLRDLAVSTGGVYVPARTTTYDLGDVYDRHLANLRRAEGEAASQAVRQDRFQVVLGVALGLLILELLVSPFARARAVARAGLLLCLVAGPLQAGNEEDAVRRVEEGLGLLGQGQAEQAVDAFAAARELSPEDLRIVFDHAVALHQATRFDEARSAYEQAATAANRELAVSALFNLGRLAVDQAQALLGEAPEELAEDQRRDLLAHLERARHHYRSCLDVDPDHIDARRSLETLLVWTRQMEQVWEERDRAARRAEMDTAAFAEWMLGEQTGLADLALATRVRPDSPARRTQAFDLAREQSTLAEEIPFLAQKLAQQWEAMLAQQAAGTGLDEETRVRVQEEMQGLFQQLAQSMDTSRQALRKDDWTGAEVGQIAALELLHQVWLGVSTFDRVLQAAVQQQDALNKDTTPHAEEDAPALLAESPMAARARRDQALVAAKAATLPASGRALLQQMEAGLAEAPPPVPAGEEGEQEGPSPEEQVEALRAAVAKAEENVPRILELAELVDQDWWVPAAAEALPRQEEILELLREIQELLPEQEQEDGEQEDGEQEQEQEEEEQQQEQEQNDEDEEEQEGQEEQNEEQQDQDQEQEQQQQEQQEQDGASLTEQQVEALLQKAAEREREGEERRKALEALVRRPGRVEKDW